MDISRPDHPLRALASRPPRPQDRQHGARTPSREDAMYERDDIDRRDETETTQEHPARCGCVECDPDFYFDRAELCDERRAA